uniref:H15 domain-containing protein n=1 Tax=Salvator merianae TaxID=96440 RepID=A0A8D0DFT9_SALMN
QLSNRREAPTPRKPVTMLEVKKKSLAPRITIGSLPNISGLLVQAIAMCQSDNGLSFTELKEVLSTKGYNVSRHCPRIKKKLQALVSKGALVRMTRSNGSTFFVVKKYPEKSSNVFESSEKNVGRQKAKVENRNAMYVPSKAKRPSKGGKNPDSKNRGKKAQSLNKKLNAGEKASKEAKNIRGALLDQATAHLVQHLFHTVARQWLPGILKQNIKAKPSPGLDSPQMVLQASCLSFQPGGSI